MTASTHMRREIEEIPAAVERLLADGMPAILNAAEALRAREPATVVTIARGSSDHAATYLKYAVEILAGVPVCSFGPSVASLYGTRLRFGRAASISVSQSGMSPDIVSATEAASEGGAMTLALTNDATSPLAGSSDFALDICAGPERSVAATKTFVSSVVCGLALIAAWREDGGLSGAIERLPGQLEQAVSVNWDDLEQGLRGKESLYISARGTSLAIASEAALKFKETCQLHAEAYSSAEIMHGPVSIVGRGFPVVCLAARDAAEPSVLETCERLVAQGADVFVTSDRETGARSLPFVGTGHPMTDPLLLVVQFYAFIERFARSRGLDPDHPPHLNKVTETV